MPLLAPSSPEVWLSELLNQETDTPPKTNIEPEISDVWETPNSFWISVQFEGYSTSCYFQGGYTDIIAWSVKTLSIFWPFSSDKKILRRSFQFLEARKFPVGMASNLPEMCGHKFRSTQKMVQMDFCCAVVRPNSLDTVGERWTRYDQMGHVKHSSDFLAEAVQSRSPRFFTIWGFSKLLRVLPCTHVKPLALLAPTILSKPLALAWHCFNRGKTNFNVKGSKSHLNHWIRMKQFFHGCLYSYKSQFRIRRGVL